MPLITRIARLFHADMNAVLDQIEEPDLLLKQAIRDMQESLDQDERQIRLKEVELKQLNNKAVELTELLDEVETKITICFKSDKDDLARSLIKRKLETQHSIALLSRKITEIEESLSLLKTGFKEQQFQLESMQQKAEIFNQEEVVTSSVSLDSSTIQDEDVEIAFLQEKEKWSAS